MQLGLSRWYAGPYHGARDLLTHGNPALYELLYELLHHTVTVGSDSYWYLARSRALSECVFLALSMCTCASSVLSCMVFCMLDVVLSACLSCCTRWGKASMSLLWFGRLSVVIVQWVEVNERA